MSDGGHRLGEDAGQSKLLDVTEFRRLGVLYERPRVVLTNDDGTIPPPVAISAFGSQIAQEEDFVPALQLSFPYAIIDTTTISATANGGTVTQSAGKAVLQTSANVAGDAQIESQGAARYSPGQGIVWRGTAIFTAGVANSRQEIGIGDRLDGFFFGYSGATFGLFRRRGGVDTFVAKSAWNGVALPSSFDPTKGNVYQIRFQWLGFGAIRYYVEDPTTGYPVLVHTIFYANTSTDVSVLNPTLPLHARVVNTGNASNLTLQTPSMGVFTEGPFNSYGTPWSTGNRKTGVGAVETAIFSIRNDTQVFGGPAGNNRSRVHLDHMSLGVSNANDGRVRLLLNTALGGAPAFAALDATRSLVSVDVAGTTVTGGRELRRWSQAGNASFNEVIGDMQIRLAPGDVATMTALALTGTINADLGLGWNEEI